MMEHFLRFVMIPAAIAPLCLLVARKRPATAGALAVATLFIGLLFTLPYLYEYHTSPFPEPPWDPVFNAAVFNSDIFSLLMTVGVYIAGVCASFFALRSLPEKCQGVWQCLLLLVVAGLCGAVTARDFFTMFVFSEAAGAALCALLAFDGSHYGVEAAVKYYIPGLPAGALVLLGNALLMFYAGGTGFKSVAAAVKASVAAPAPLAVILGLLACGYMIKAALAPFHAWKADSCQGAGAPAAAVLSGAAVAAAGLYPLIRVAMALRALYPAHSGDCVGPAIMLFGMLSVLVGVLGAFAQRNLRRMLAFAAVSQYGMAALAAGIGTQYAFSGAIYQMFNTMFCMTALFLLAGIVERWAGACDLRRLGGLEARIPLVAVPFAVLLLSLAGMPPFSGFWAKLFIMSALWKEGCRLYVCLSLLSSGILLLCFARTITGAFSGRAEVPRASAQANDAWLSLPSVLLALLAVAAGLYFPSLFTLFVFSAAGVKL
jgi:multicomponent Na+:H+ antiporter subunit D